MHKMNVSLSMQASYRSPTHRSLARPRLKYLADWLLDAPLGQDVESAAAPAHHHQMLPS